MMLDIFGIKMQNCACIIQHSVAIWQEKTAQCGLFFEITLVNGRLSDELCII